MLDTNIAIHLGDGEEAVLQKFEGTSGAVLLSALTLVELQRQIYKYAEHTAGRHMRLATMLRSIPVLPFDEAAANAYGRIIARIGWAKGRDYDRMIAAHAIAAQAVLVTNNEDDFRDIPDLRVENWFKS